MHIAVYGGSFNPPHAGHVAAARQVLDTLKPDRLLIVPANTPPHKPLESGSPGACERFRLAQLAFGQLPHTTVTDIEVRREGPSYTVDTLSALAAAHPGAALTLVMGGDMLLTIEHWRDYRRIMELAALAAFPRETGELPALQKQAAHLKKTYGARVTLLTAEPLPMNSTWLREQLPDRGGRNLLPGAVYADIIRHRLYGAQPDLAWLREESFAFLNEARIPHVMGCEQAAVELAESWGAPADLAAEAGILHDITKKFSEPEQLRMCEKYGIINDIVEIEHPKLLHAKTGAALARDLFGVSDEVYSAIRWHTVGRAHMTTLEQVIYMADYTEPTRDFEGVERLRALTREDLGAAMIAGLQMSREEVEGKGAEPHPDAVAAMEWFLSGKEV